MARYIWGSDICDISFANITGSPTDNTNLATALNAKANTNGTYDSMTVGTAKEITPKSDIPATVQQQLAIATTGGDADIKAGSATVKSIKGSLTKSGSVLHPFNAASLVSTAMNMLDPQTYFTSGSSKVYYFPVVAGSWGSYGTTQSNNGYIVVGASPLSVKYKASKPASASDGTTCPTHTEEGNTYYLPPVNGWLLVEMSSSDTAPACHIVWSNYNDTVAGTFSNSTLSIATAISAVHSWGLAGLTGVNYAVTDELDFTANKWYRRIDRTALAASSLWSLTTETSGEGESEVTTYIFTATISAMKNGGLWAVGGTSLDFTVSGTSLIHRSTTVTTVADLVALFTGDTFIYYELATVVSGTLGLSSSINADDFGLTYFLGSDGELSSYKGVITIAYQQGGKDQLFNSVTYQKTLAEVISTALCELDARLSTIENKKASPFELHMVRFKPTSAASEGSLGDIYIDSTEIFFHNGSEWKKVTLTSLT